MDNRPAREAPQHTPVSGGDPTRLGARPGAGGRPLKPRNAAWEKDALTGLHGQRYLCRAIDECLKQGRRRKITATLALLQLENFYEIRSWVGISEADLLLSDIARLLKQALPNRVLLCRCHNYEFAALLLGDCSVNAGLIADKLKQALLSAVSPSLPRQLELKCGVGLAKLESNIPSWPVVFARARHNLSLAHYHRELPAQLSSIGPDVALKQVHSALARRELALNFQAWAHLHQDSPEHYELRCALSQQAASIPNLVLFEAAARNALGEQLDRRIIEQLLAGFAASIDSERRLVLNLSHNSVISLPFLRWLEEVLGQSPALATRLVFQISETDALIAQHHLITFCEVIEQLGSKISLSNFGCTPDPLRYLSLVPASYVKLDSGILQKIDVNQERLEYLNTLCTELHARQIGVVAAMLEQLTNVPLLWQARVDYLQGNCLHRPAATMDYRFLETLRVSFD